MKVVAKALLIDSTGDLLLLNRGMTHPHFPGHLDLPGGEVEDGEAWETAIAREIAEEAGIDIDVALLEKVFEIQHPTVLHVLYIAKVDTEQPKVILSWEHSNYRWISNKELLKIPLPDGVDRYYLDVIKHMRIHHISGLAA